MGSHTLLLLAALAAAALGAAVPAAPVAPSTLMQPPPVPLEDNNIIEADNNLLKTVIKTETIPANQASAELPLKYSDEKTKIETPIDDVSADSDIEVEIKRVKVDLNNPGEPQRQEHNSQSPEEQSEEQQTVTNIKQTIADTQIVFKQGLQGVSEGFQNWFSNNEQMTAIQQSIQNFQLNFQNQINKLNATIQGFWKPEQGSQGSPSTPDSAASDASANTVLDNVEKRLEAIENNFQYGVKSMVDGAQVLAQTKADNGTTATNNPFSNLAQYMQQFQTNIVQNFNNLTSTIQNFINQNQQNTSNTSSGPNGFFQNIGQGIQNIIGQQNTGSASNSEAQADEQVTLRPTIWQGLQSSFQNIWNRPGFNTSQLIPASVTNNNGNGPFVQAIQNNPIIQGIQGFIQPKPQTPAKPSDVSQDQAADAQPDKVDADVAQGEKEGPAPVEQAAADTPVEAVAEVTAAAETVAPVTEPAKPPGPLAQIVQQNPIVAGLAGAMQRIQHTITHPERPRDQEKDAVRAGWWPRPPPPQNHSPAQGDNNDGNGGRVASGKSESAPAQQPPVAPVKTEQP